MLCEYCYKKLENCTCDNLMTRRLEKRDIGKLEYRSMYSDYRNPNKYPATSALNYHFHAVKEAARDMLLAPAYPDWFQYVPVSQKYRDYQTEQIADYGASQQEIELERQAELYHLGY